MAVLNPDHADAEEFVSRELIIYVDVILPLLVVDGHNGLSMMGKMPHKYNLTILFRRLSWMSRLLTMQSSKTINIFKFHKSFSECFKRSFLSTNFKFQNID